MVRLVAKMSLEDRHERLTRRDRATNAVGDTGGKPKFFDLYKKIIKAGKAAQAVGVTPEEVIPLLDAVGPEGLFITVHAPSEEKARKLEEQVAKYRPSRPRTAKSPTPV